MVLIVSWFSSCCGAILFYSRLPLPPAWPVSFERIARWSPLVGVGLALILAMGQQCLLWGNFLPLVQAALLVALWLWLTGGLHLDGAADTADGLAVPDPDRRLVVMRDSVTGAFGVMAIAIILLLKTIALGTLLEQSRQVHWLLITTLGWARWGQVLAIAAYPYLRAEGKGALHRRSLKLPQDLLLGPIFLGLIAAFWAWQQPENSLIILRANGISLAIAAGNAHWFGQQLGGHTGDSYGAVVEWSEVLILSCLSALIL